ncbi:hypothetical protein [Actinopolyspora halophila]|uniref:hypothetical protein n=1 Tax=Actinopolyspora halophila TaxID=1850 RepID=UPI00037C97AD|nr:hypothetical protein [Actinopolyspora halophila]
MAAARAITTLTAGVISVIVLLVVFGPFTTRQLVVVVTGGSRGIGAAIAHALAENGSA